MGTGGIRMKHYIKIIHYNESGDIEAQSCADGEADEKVLSCCLDEDDIETTPEEIYLALKAYRERVK